MPETLGADGAGVRPLSCVDAKVRLQVLQAVELSVAHRAAERAATGGVKLQSGPLAPGHGRLRAILEPLLALAVVPPQQAGQVEGLPTVLTAVRGVVEAAAGPDVHSKSLWRGF